MTAHLIDDDTAPTTGDPTTDDPTTDDPTTDAWLALSAAMTDAVPDIADREDLIVTIAPGAGHGSPACFLPHHATVEVDGTHLGIDPATADPNDPRDRARYPEAWGLLTHEAAHARHSTWTPPASTPPTGTAPTGTAPASTSPASTPPAAVMEAAMLLEETRIEAAQIRRRPDDRHWLRASATGLILADTIGAHPEDPDRIPPPLTAWAAGRAAALILARVDAGILTATETTAVTDAVGEAIGADTLTALRGLWTAALDVGDDDRATMVDLARRWCHELGTDPDAPPESTTTGSGDGDEDRDGDGGSADGPASGAALEEAIREVLAAVAAAVATEAAPVPPLTPAAAARAAETTALTDAEQAALRVFGSGHARTGTTATAGTRPPTDAEQAAARALSRALTTAGRRDRTATTVTSPTPPGRLRMRGALAADAQRAAGAVPTAEPFSRTVRRSVPTPPLRLGIACDVSGSMAAVTGPVASAAWILARAAHLTPMTTTTATVIFGTWVRAITRPGIVPARVTEFTAGDGYEDVTTAIDALDHSLGLSRPGAARLLVIVSDGAFHPDQTTTGQARTDRLLAAGCAVLWLDAYGWCRPFRGATVHRLTDPTTTAQAIGRAATAALRTTA